MTGSIGVAVVGAGMAGRSHAAGYRVAPSLYGPGLPEVRPVAIADVNPDFAGETARRFGYERAETSWQAVAEAPDVDVVSVVLANPLHREVVEGLLAAGKHVLCEKPLAPSTADAESMVAAAEASGRVSAVGFTFRRSPAIAAVADLVASGALGRPLHFLGGYFCDYGADPRGPMSWRYKGGPGSGALADIGSHAVDTAELVCGPITAVRGAVLSTVVAERALPKGNAVGHAAAELSDRVEPVENEDLVTFSARFASGALATLSISRVAFGLANALSFEVFAERGSAAFDLLRPGEIQVTDQLIAGPTQGTRRVPIGPAHPYLAGGLPMDFPGVGYGQNDLFGFQARAFLEQVCGIEGLPPCPPLSAGLANLRLLDAVVASAAAGGAEVAVPGPGDLDARPASIPTPAGTPTLERTSR